MSDEKFKETSDGIYKLVKTRDGEYWSKVEDPNYIKDRVPFSCPACKKLMYNIDDKSFYCFGTCLDFEIQYIEDRHIPQELLRSRPDLLKYIQQKIEETTQKK